MNRLLNGPTGMRRACNADDYRSKKSRALWLRNAIAGNKVSAETLIHSSLTIDRAVSLCGMPKISDGGDTEY